MSALASVLKRDRLIVGCGLGIVAGVAWWHLFSEARRMKVSGVCEDVAMKMGGPDLASWPLVSVLPLFVMWAVMMVAMMLPSATPMILTFAAVTRNRRQRDRPYVPVAVFASGYLFVWCLFSAIAAMAQWALHRSALLSSTMASTSVFLGALVLIGAGVFQFTPLKHACLRHCRTPLEFIMTRWREGWRGAFGMGLRHGAFCAGCCWVLMLLLFVGGVMN
ncbi:MAG TPA: DUF2182 domain-containing protein, partial [Candidatus Acidoferrum sp.]